MLSLAQASAARRWPGGVAGAERDVPLAGGGGVLFAFGSAMGARGKHQRAGEFGGGVAGQVMRDLYPRLFEAPVLANGLPRICSTALMAVRP